MKNFLAHLTSGESAKATSLVEKALKAKTLGMIREAKKQVAAETFGEEVPLQEQIEEAYLTEAPKVSDDKTDHALAKELYHYAVRRHHEAVKKGYPGNGNLQAWADNYKKKMKGTKKSGHTPSYDEDKAVHGLTHAIKHVEDDYFGVRRGWDGKKTGHKPTISYSTRHAAAKQLLPHVHNMIHGRDFHHGIDESEIHEGKNHTFDDIEHGDTVHYKTPQGQTFSGKAHIYGGEAGDHWVLDGKRGMPSIVSRKNFVKVKKSGKPADPKKNFLVYGNLQGKKNPVKEETKVVEAREPQKNTRVHEKIKDHGFTYQGTKNGYRHYTNDQGHEIKHKFPTFNGNHSFKHSDGVSPKPIMYSPNTGDTEIADHLEKHYPKKKEVKEASAAELMAQKLQDRKGTTSAPSKKSAHNFGDYKPSKADWKSDERMPWPKNYFTSKPRNQSSMAEEYITEISQSIPWPRGNSKHLKDYKNTAPGVYEHPDGHKIEINKEKAEVSHTPKGRKAKKFKHIGNLNVHLMKFHGGFDDKVKQHILSYTNDGGAGFNHLSHKMGSLSYKHHKKNEGDPEDNAVNYKAMHSALMKMTKRDRGVR